MAPRPRGITILAVVMGINVLVYAGFTLVSLSNPAALANMLATLSPGGSGPERHHLGMGAFLPLYYLAGIVITSALAAGLWNLRNWARLILLALVVFTAVSLVAGTPVLWRGPTAGAVALFVLRAGLCALLGSYLLSTGVRRAFRRPLQPSN